jgi:rubrerythrin
MSETLTKRTFDDLRATYASDAQTAALCDYFARLAELEGHPEVATLLRELAEAHALYAAGDLDLLTRRGDPLLGAPVGDALTNLRATLAARLEAADDSLPARARAARDEGMLDVASWFETLSRAQREHAGALERALALLVEARK